MQNLCMLLKSVRVSFFSILSIPPSISQNVNNKGCLVCPKIEKYAFWVTLRPLGPRVHRTVRAAPGQDVNLKVKKNFENKSC